MCWCARADGGRGAARGESDARERATRTEVRDLFARNVSAERIEQALGVLARDGRAERRRTPTAGRPAECWFAGAPES